MRWNLLVPASITLITAYTAFMILLWKSSAQAPQPITFSAKQLQNTPLVGLSLPEDQLDKRPQLLTKQLGTHFSIIGRTQDIAERFDNAWAQTLVSRRQQPWIILEFGHFGTNGKPPLTSSLPAIGNGMQDGQLKRWAQDIHTYGQPVYLTVLLHVDRNWSVSSAVANGGIPADASRAWLHIRSVFSTYGDTNVFWIWAPADPANDKLYAPPVSSIDGVLLSMISYPHAVWSDPEKTLQMVVKRYPDKPLLVEAGANGPAGQKIKWLSSVETAVRSTPEVFAFIYHEGAPGGKATNTENKDWSIISDDHSIPALRRMLTTL